MRLLPKYSFAFSLLLILFFRSGSVSGQITYHHYLDSTFRWTEGEIHPFLGGPGDPCVIGGIDLFERYFHVVGQEEIDGLWWYQVHMDHKSTHECNGSPPTYWGPFGTQGIETWIREDSTGKIWSRNRYGDIYLEFDFGLPYAVGDTLWMKNHYNPCPIASIDTVNFGPIRRARYHCDCPNGPDPSYVVEGAGLNIGLFNPYSACWGYADVSFYTSCVKLGTHTLVMNPNYGCSSVPHTVLATDSPIQPAWNIQWNPSTQLLTLETQSPQENPQWRLVDLNGKVLRSGQFSGNSMQLEGLSSGVYLLQVYTDKASQVVKLPVY